MTERRRRSKNVRIFRHERSDSGDGRRDADEADPIVVHVHVHRDGAGPPQVQATAARTAPRPPPPRRRPRPTLRGQLFDWKEHYDVVAKRHLDEAERRPPTLRTALAAALRQGRAIFLTLAAFVLLRDRP